MKTEESNNYTSNEPKESELTAANARIAELEGALESVRLIDHTQKRFGIIDSTLKTNHSNKPQ